MKKLVACSEFVKRQTAESGYSHYNGTWSELEWLVEYTMYYHNATNMRKGYKEGVYLVDVPADNFFSAIVEINEETQLSANFAPRVVGEAPYIRISSVADKQPAKFASVVIYHKLVLEEDAGRSTEAEWEIVAIKARTSEEEEPMDPYTMARNFLHLKGGTKGDFTAQQFAESIVYWNNHCMTTSKEVPWHKKVCQKISAVGHHFWQTLPEREKL